MMKQNNLESWIKVKDVTLSNQMFELQVYTFVFCVQIQLGPNGIEFRKSD